MNSTRLSARSASTRGRSRSGSHCNTLGTSIKPSTDNAAARPLWNTRLAVLLAAAIALLATVIFYAPHNWFLALAVMLIDGGRSLLWTAGAAALGAVLLRWLRLSARPTLHVASAAGLGLGMFGLIALGLGLCGWLNRATALALPIGSAIAFAIVYRRQLLAVDEAALRRALLAPAGSAWLWVLITVPLATSAVGACVMPGDLWRPLDPHPYDVTSYHLQVPREWYDAGRILPLHHNVFSYFPFNVEIQYLLLMHATGGWLAPWRAMYSCQFLSVIDTVLLVMAVAGACEGLAGMVAAAVVAAVPWTIMLGSVAYVEAGLMLYTALALGWMLRSPRSGWRAMLLAGVFAGLAAGVKITAVPMLVIAVPVAVCALIGRKRENHGGHGGHGGRAEEFEKGIASAERTSHFSVSSVVFSSAVFVVAAGIILSPWLLRNLVWSGNPLFPVAMRALGHDGFTPIQIERFRIAHSPTAAEAGILGHLGVLWRDVLSNWEYGYLVLPAGVVAAIWRRREPAVWMLAIVGAFTFGTWIGFTHLLPRFLVMLIPIAGLLLGRVHWRAAWPAGALLALAAVCIGEIGVYPRLTYTTNNAQQPERAALIGIQNMALFVPDDLTPMLGPEGRPIGLVGDAGAFLYQVPMKRLRYRTVFDLSGEESDPIAAWVGADAEHDPNWLLVINPDEIRRLHATYFDVPALPQKWAGQEKPFVVEGGE